MWVQSMTGGNDDLLRGLPPADTIDPVVEAYKPGIDRGLIRESLKLTIEQRLRRFQSFLESREAWKGAADSMK